MDEAERVSKLLKIRFNHTVEMMRLCFHGDVEHKIKAYPELMTAVNKEGETLMSIATQRGFSGGLAELIKAGADVNEPINNQIPLRYAVNNGHVDCVRVLLAAGSKGITEAKKLTFNPEITALLEGALHGRRPRREDVGLGTPALSLLREYPEVELAR